MICGGDTDSAYAHYCLHALKITPSQYINFSPYERAFIKASIDLALKGE